MKKQQYLFFYLGAHDHKVNRTEIVTTSEENKDEKQKEFLSSSSLLLLLLFLFFHFLRVVVDLIGRCFFLHAKGGYARHVEASVVRNAALATTKEEGEKVNQVSSALSVCFVFLFLSRSPLLSPASSCSFWFWFSSALYNPLLYFASPHVHLLLFFSCLLSLRFFCFVLTSRLRA